MLAFMFEWCLFSIRFIHLYQSQLLLLRSHRGILQCFNIWQVLQNKFPNHLSIISDISWLSNLRGVKHPRIEMITLQRKICLDIFTIAILPQFILHTSAVGKRKIPGSSASWGGEAGKGGVTLYYIARAAAVTDFVSNIESGPVLVAIH